MSEGYVPGDHWVLCDECGFKVRASETRKRWDGLRVCMADFETRHPQDYVRGKRDRQAVRNARPEPPNRFVGNETLTDDDPLIPLQDDNYAELTDDA